MLRLQGRYQLSVVQRQRGYGNLDDSRSACHDHTQKKHEQCRAALRDSDRFSLGSTRRDSDAGRHDIVESGPAEAYPQEVEDNSRICSLIVKVYMLIQRNSPPDQRGPRVAHCHPDHNNTSSSFHHSLRDRTIPSALPGYLIEPSDSSVLLTRLGNLGVGVARVVLELVGCGRTQYQRLHL